MIKEDEVRLSTMEYLKNNPQGHISDLLEKGHELNIIEELRSLGFISITQLFAKDKHGRYRVTSLGKEYFDIVT